MPRRSWIWITGVLLVTAVILLPVILHLRAPTKHAAPALQYALVYGVIIAAAAVCYAFKGHLNQRERVDTVLLCVVLSMLTNYLHYWLVDTASYSWGPNVAVQKQLHETAIALDPDFLPHSYRFLPDAIIRIFEQVTGSFESARDTYRNFFGVVLFYVLYRFARLSLRHGGALLCLAFWAAVSPVSFRYYAGQPADPLSHLSFLLAFIFIETEQFAPLLLTLLIGSLAKETVLALAGYYALFRGRERQFLAKAATLLVAAFAVYLGVRMFILRSAPQYQQISGVSGEHIGHNWANYSQWLGCIGFTAGIFVPFAALGWRAAPKHLRTLILYLGPVLFLSSLGFSWLREARNFMPLCAPLIVMTVHYLMPEQRRVDQGEGRTSEQHPRR